MTTIEAVPHRSDATEALLSTAPARRLHPVARRLPFVRLHPAAAAFVTALVGYLAVLGATVLLGWVLIELVLPGWINHTDNEANIWLAGQRTPTWDDLSALGSGLGETVTVVALCALMVIVLSWRRRWYAACFVAVSISLEALVYLGTVLVIDRPRPHVVRLEDLAAGASYPSGHTAAAVVTYGALALVVCSSTGRRWVRTTVLVIAVLAPAAVALARVYRGMHHPIDVVSGALMGGGCLVVGLLVADVARRAANRRSSWVTR